MRTALLLALSVWLVPGLAMAQQYKSEYRVFVIKVEDKDSGSYSQTITTYGEGTTDVASKADVKVKVLGMSFQYAYRANERWKENKLQYLASASNDDGKPHTLMVTAENNQLKVKEGGKERAASPTVWTSTYWTLPMADRRSQNVIVLDADTGIEHQLTMQMLGKENLMIAGQRVPCTHYKLSGTLQVDLWFDEGDRLIRRDMIRKGRRTSMTLVSATVK